ncbi:helix-turn-helix domain-containing protein [Kocuria rhizophila]|nr:helix-turn-helix domain-containing protein [Kocuria rhizophila]
MPNLVSLVEAADQFGVSVKTLRRRISDGTIHGYRVGRLIRVDLKELHERLLIEMPTMR